LHGVSTIIKVDNKLIIAITINHVQYARIKYIQGEISCN